MLGQFWGSYGKVPSRRRLKAQGSRLNLPVLSGSPQCLIGFQSSQKRARRVYKYLNMAEANNKVQESCMSKVGNDFFRGITDDFNRRWPHYFNDWTEGGANLKVLAAILFIFAIFC